jgi:hypothetical protein
LHAVFHRLEKIYQGVFFAARGNSRTFHCGVILP